MLKHATALQVVMLSLAIAAVLAAAFLPSLSDRSSWIQATTSVITLVLLWRSIDMQSAESARRAQDQIATNKSVRSNARAVIRSSRELRLLRVQTQADHEVLAGALDVLRASFLADHLPIIELHAQVLPGKLLVTGLNAGSGTALVTGVRVQCLGEKPIQLDVFAGRIAAALGVQGSSVTLAKDWKPGGAWKSQQHSRIMEFTHPVATSVTAPAMNQLLTGAVVAIDFTAVGDATPQTKTIKLDDAVRGFIRS